MATNTIIRLPLGVHSRRVADVIAKVVGVPYRIKTHDETHYVPGTRGQKSIKTPVPFDETLPASRENPWYVDFEVEYKEVGLRQASPNEMSYGYLCFPDATGTKHEWMYHMESEDENCVEIRPGSHGFAVAVGQRLVKFFGGHLVNCDDTDKINLVVPNSRAKFPRKTKSQQSNERGYQFLNALAAEPLLTAPELETAINHYGSNSLHNQFLSYLQVIGRQQALTDIAEAASVKRLTPAPKTPKL